MAVDRVKFQDIVASQLPRYVSEDFPLLTQFLEQYYVSQEFESGPVDLLKNIDQYVKVDNLTNLTNSTTLSQDVGFDDVTITVTSTEGFSDTNGLIKIGEEIIQYGTKTSTTFESCNRGFSGITTYITSGKPDQLTFSSSVAEEHPSGGSVQNLNIIFLQEFFKKLKGQVTPGFSERPFYSGLDQRNFLYNSDSFYSSKGTEQSYEILFRALYGEDVEVLKPSRFLLTPSNADYKVTNDFVVEKISGDPLKLKNLTIFQNLTGARGSVTNVEPIPYDDHQYFQISIDSGFQRDSDVTGSIFGNFKPNPLTKAINDVAIGATIVDVDSTIGFPESGEIEAIDRDGERLVLSYDGKTLTQFFNVSGVSNIILKQNDVALNDFSYAYVGINTEEQIKVRFVNTLQNFVDYEDSFYYLKDDTVEIKSIGYEARGKKANNNFLNVKSNWKVKDIEVIDADIFSYKFTFFDKHFLKEGYSVTLENPDRTIIVPGRVVRTNTSTEVIVNFSSVINPIGEYIIENNTLKGKSTRYPYLQNYIANVQNVYSKFNGDVIIASNSIPNYSDTETNPYDKKITFSASLLSTDTLTLPVNPTSIPDHGYYTGDSVYFTSNGNGFEGVPSGAYFVYRVDAQSIKLSRSYADLSRKTYITFNGSVVNASLAYLPFYSKSIQPQNLFRKILNPVNDGNEYVSPPGYTGIFNNGVELLNYKSQNSVYYGEIENFSMTSGGSGYDIINPPILNIQDEVGAGASGVCNVKGELVRLEVTDGGLGYYEKPTITISGGNGIGAKAEARMKSIVHENSFIANFPDQVDLTNNSIIFTEDHKFLDGERVFYQPRDQKVISGLTTESSYFVQVTGQKSLTLHQTPSDAVAGINTVTLDGFGEGTQYLVASELKQVVSSVVVLDPGKNYENKRRTIPSVGVNTASNRVEIKNHGFQSKEIVRYTRTSPGISGLSQEKDYYVVKVNDDEFSLTEVGVGTIAKDYYYDNGIIIDFPNEGRGSFNYPPIFVDVQGPAASFDKTFVEDFQELFVIESPIEENIITPVAVLAWTDTEAEITNPYYVLVSEDANWLISDDPFIGNILLYEAKLQPVFRGSIESIDLVNSGVGYGSSEIIGFMRQPELTYESGKDAKLTPIINNGQISQVIVNIPGEGYNSPPDLRIVSETGDFAVLVPEVSGGKITNVIVSKGGAGYVSGKTSIDVIPAGQGARANAQITSWGVNLFERNFANILSDDGILNENISDETLQYCSFYAPRRLRAQSNAINGFDSDNELYGTFDLQVNNDGEEDTNVYHSPILGWAYDGNPIYGPYGFENNNGTGVIRRMRSGYKLTTLINRPSYDNFPNGFFVNDYIFVGDGDLDIHNGRFCVTPDYPNGVYAYFCTISDEIDSSGPFTDFRRPVFPYVIGESYKSTPIDFNFKSLSNQNNYDIVKEGWFRNTYNYYTTDDKRGYNYIYNSDKVRNQSIDITGTSVGYVDKLSIIDPGTDYRINDEVIFNNEGTGGRNASWRVSEVTGKKINSVSLATTSFSNIEFTAGGNYNRFVGINSTPHNLETNDLIFIDGVSSNFNKLKGTYNVGVNKKTWRTNLGIATDSVTGITTYLYFSDSVSNLVPDDVIKIDDEKFKVLNIDEKSNRVRVIRKYDNTFAFPHTAGTLVEELPRTFEISTNEVPNSYNSPNYKIYFNPAESVGVGTATAGTATTITFSNPGVGQTEITLQQRQIYLPNHNLVLNSKINYDVNGGSSINAWSGIVTTNNFNISNSTNLYAVPLSKDIIGLSTTKVGISSTTGEYVSLASTDGLTYGDLLYFVNVGAGDTHSFTTVKSNVIEGRISKNVVTVSTAQTHGLLRGDYINIDINPTTTTNIVVTYNDYIRRMVFDEDTIQPTGINTSLNTFDVPPNKYNTGDKVVYTSDDAAQNLTDNGMYYVYIEENTKIKLVKYAFELNKANPSFVNVGSATTSRIGKINPEFKIQKNQNIRFNLSDSSLSFINAGLSYPAFDMYLYTDGNLNNKFWISENSKEFEVTKSGVVGVDTDANLNLFVSDNIPSNLYYGFEIDNVDIIPPTKKNIFVDTTVSKNNQINLIKNKFDGRYMVTGVTTDTFRYNIPYDRDVITSYGSTNSTLSYNTTSRNVYGPINKLTVVNKGVGYKSLPGFDGIRSQKGFGALIQTNSSNIGKVKTWKFNNIGFGYPSDQTLNCVANLPEIMKIEPLASFESIGITSAGINYIVAPDLVVIDAVSNEQITDLEIDYELGDTEVNIIQNTISLNNVTPSIIPIRNSNGFSISSVTYNNTSKVVRLYLSKQFSNASDWPFIVGEEIIVENVAIGVGTNGKGYNSENYEYKLFEITSLDSQLGGSGAYVEYSLSEELTGDDYPGNVTDVSAASLTLKSHFPIFDPKLKISNFFDGEKVFTDQSVGVVERWDPVSEYLFVSTKDDFNVGDILQSETSQIKSRISSKIDFDSTIQIGVGATFIDGWQTNSGFLNDNLQVIPNNEYYQNFSYSLKSRVPYDTWDDSVSSLNHTAGFDKYADLVIDNDAVGLATVADIEIETVIDLIGEGMLNCFPDFDGGRETTIFVGNNKFVSNEIIFENKVLVDYFESRGNRVLNIDDISSQFNSNPRETPYSVITSFEDSQTFNKIFTLVQDTELRDRKQFSIVSVLQDGNDGYVSEYGIVNTRDPYGYFDYMNAGDRWNLIFYPNLFEYNNYEVSYFNMSSFNNITSIGSTDIGSVTRISTASTQVSVGTTTTLVSISNTYRSAKLLIQLEDENNNLFANELSILHDGTDVETLRYGDIDNKTGLAGLAGFGTYNAKIDGSDIVVEIIPTVGTALTATTSVIAIADNGTGISTTNLLVTDLSSYYTQIASSGSPVPVPVASFATPFNSEYYIVQVEDTTNNRYEFSEVNVLENIYDENIVQYGRIVSHSGLGTVGISTTGTRTELTFTPISGIDVNVRVFGIALKNYDNTSGVSSIGLNNNILQSFYGTYTGTEYDKKTDFELTSKQLPIFERTFVGNASTVVNVDSDVVTLPNHYFVTGEKVTYTYEGSTESTANAIGIASTVVAGVSTDKLPNELYIVKVSDSTVGFAKSAMGALVGTPEKLDLTSVGIGTLHKFTSTNQNARALVAVDNMIQAPVTPVLVTTELDEDIIFDVDFAVTGITSFKANDLIQIDNEIMLLQNIGVGATNNFKVLRARLGTKVESHSIGSTINLLGGNYNIVDSTINFASAPYGQTPIGTTTGSPDERDWTGITTSSTFQGRTFMRSGVPDSDQHTYFTNYTFDNIQSQFNGIEKYFTLTVNNSNVTGFATDQMITLNSNILQEPQGAQSTTGDFTLEQTAGITSITFLGESTSSEDDPNRATIPRGGTIVAIAMSQGLGYQPIVSAGGTAMIGVGGTIESIAMGNTGSGYRTGIQTVNVGVVTSSVGINSILNIGVGDVSSGFVTSVTLNGIGTDFDADNPPVVVFDAPLAYSNVPLIYKAGSTGLGTGARVDLQVGAGSSVINVDVLSGGYGYGQGEVLTVAVGGTDGIPLDNSFTFKEFEITVDDVYRDTFNGFTIGELDVFDTLDELFDGETKRFALKIASEQYSIERARGSLINIEQCLIVTINDILQKPGEGYFFNGGSIIEFSEPPKPGDTSKIIFYKGTPEIDVVLVDILETVKPGDTLQLKNDTTLGQSFGLYEDPRTVSGITTLDTVKTVTYEGPGISTNLDTLRPITWCKQINDITINGDFVTKDRISYEPSIFPAAYLISYVGVLSTSAYVDTVRPLFDADNETTLIDYQFRIEITDQAPSNPAFATATVSAAGTITGFTMTNVGSGYTGFTPTVSISEPGIGTRATATVTLNTNSVTGINVVNPGSGYTNTNPPQVLIQEVPIKSETINVQTYTGDDGIIVGYAQSSASLATVDLYIPKDSFMRDTAVVGTAVTISGISTGDFFTINHSTVGLNTDNFDGIYQATHAYTIQKDLSSVGIGTTMVRRVEFVSSGLGTDDGLFKGNILTGNYSWGKIDFLGRTLTEGLEFTPTDYSGISSSPLVTRSRPLRFTDYT